MAMNPFGLGVIAVSFMILILNIAIAAISKPDIGEGKIKHIKFMAIFNIIFTIAVMGIGGYVTMKEFKS